MKQLRVMGLLFGFMVAAVALAACGGGGGGTGSTSEGSGATDSSAASSGESGQPIVIGAAYSQSGLAAAFDGSAYDAFKVWVDDQNANGGISGRPIKVVTANAKSSPEGAKAAAEEVISKGAEMVVAPCDFDLGSAAGIAAEKAGLVNFSLCSASAKWGVQGIGPNAFTPAVSAIAEGYALADYSFSQRGLKTAALILDDSLPSYTEGVCGGYKKRYEELGGKILTEETFTGGEEVSSLDTQINSIKSANPEVITMCTYPPGGPAAIKQMRAAGIQTPIMSDLSMDGSYWLEATPNLSNFYTLATASTYGDDPNPEVNRVVKAYEKLAGEPPLTSVGLTGYVLGQLYAAAVEKAGSTDTEAVTKALNETTEEPTLLGPMTYTPEVHIALTRPMAVIEIKNGKPSFLETTQTAGEPPLFLE
jgi:branched-chain amino acid transport system substrate-binding protein